MMSTDIDREFVQFMDYTKNKFNVNLIKKLSDSFSTRGNIDQSMMPPNIEFYFRKYVEKRRYDEMDAQNYFNH